MNSSQSGLRPASWLDEPMSDLSSRSTSPGMRFIMLLLPFSTELHSGCTVDQLRIFLSSAAPNSISSVLCEPASGTDPHAGGSSSNAPPQYISLQNIEHSPLSAFSTISSPTSPPASDVARDDSGQSKSSPIVSPTFPAPRDRSLSTEFIDEQHNSANSVPDDYQALKSTKLLEREPKSSKSKAKSREPLPIPKNPMFKKKMENIRGALGSSANPIELELSPREETATLREGHSLM
jgi:hypothetical protein